MAWRTEVAAKSPLLVERLDEMADGEVEFVQELYDTFVESSEDDLAKIRAGVESNDTRAYRLSAHSLKGSALSLGLEKLSTIASLVEKGANTLLEQKISDQVAPEASEQIVVLEECLKEALEALKQYIADASEAAPTG